MEAVGGRHRGENRGEQLHGLLIVATRQRDLTQNGVGGRNLRVDLERLLQLGLGLGREVLGLQDLGEVDKGGDIFFFEGQGAAVGLGRVRETPLLLVDVTEIVGPTIILRHQGRRVVVAGFGGIVELVGVEESPEAAEGGGQILD